MVQAAVHVAGVSRYRVAYVNLNGLIMMNSDGSGKRCPFKCRCRSDIFVDEVTHKISKMKPDQKYLLSLTLLSKTKRLSIIATFARCPSVTNFVDSIKKFLIQHGKRPTGRR
jgi:hypothetical protein